MRLSQTTATGSACSGDSATSSCAAAHASAAAPCPAKTNVAQALRRLTCARSLHCRLIVRVQRQGRARHAVRAPAVPHWHKVRVVPALHVTPARGGQGGRAPRHERHGSAGVVAVELGKAPSLRLAGVMCGVISAGRDHVCGCDADGEQDDGILAAGRRRLRQREIIAQRRAAAAASATCAQTTCIIAYRVAYSSSTAK